MADCLTIPVRYPDGSRYKVREMLAAMDAQFPDGVPKGTVVRFAEDPVWSLNTVLFLTKLCTREIIVKPEISTTLPNEADVPGYLNSLVNLMNTGYKNRITLTLMLGSTSERSRSKLYGHPFGLASLVKLFEHLPELQDEQQIALAFDPFCPLDAAKLHRQFSPDRFTILLHPTDTVNAEMPLFDNLDLKEKLRALGYTVAVCA